MSNTQIKKREIFINGSNISFSKPLCVMVYFDESNERVGGYTGYRLDEAQDRVKDIASRYSPVYMDVMYDGEKIARAKATPNALKNIVEERIVKKKIA